MDLTPACPCWRLKYVILIGILTLVTLGVSQASELRSEIAVSIERFSRWNTTMVNMVRMVAKAKRTLPDAEVMGIKFLYVPVRADINGLIDRIITDINLGNHLDHENYRPSITNAQRRVDDFESHIQKVMIRYHVMAEVGDMTDLFSFLANILSILSALGGAKEDLKDLERTLIFERLNGLKLPPFEEIAGSPEKGFHGG